MKSQVPIVSDTGNCDTNRKLDLSSQVFFDEGKKLALQRIPFGVTELNISKCALSAFPVIDGSARIQCLHVSENLLQSIDLSGHQFAVLQTLSISRNHFSALPASFALLSMLRHLDVSSNFLVSLPEEVRGLRSLQTLNARSNRIVFVHTSLWQLPELKDVDLSHNAITALGAEVGTAPALVHLRLASNPLTALPASLVARALPVLDLTGTPVFHPHSSAATAAAAALPQSPVPRTPPARATYLSSPAAPDSGSVAGRPVWPAASATPPGTPTIAPLRPLLASAPVSAQGDEATALRAEAADLRTALASAETAAAAAWAAERAGLVARLAVEEVPSAAPAGLRLSV
jgi:hypothetical protein